MTAHSVASITMHCKGILNVFFITLFPSLSLSVFSLSPSLYVSFSYSLSLYVYIYIFSAFFLPISFFFLSFSHSLVLSSYCFCNFLFIFHFFIYSLLFYILFKFIFSVCFSLIIFSYFVCICPTVPRCNFIHCTLSLLLFNVNMIIPFCTIYIYIHTHTLASLVCVRITVYVAHCAWLANNGIYLLLTCSNAPCSVQRATCSGGSLSARRGYQLTVVKVASVRTDNHSYPTSLSSLSPSLSLHTCLSLL